MENWGIYISKQDLIPKTGYPFGEGKLDPFPKKGYSIGEYNIYAGKASRVYAVKNRMLYISNPAVRKVLQEANKPLTYIGYFDIRIDSDAKMITTIHVYPTTPDQKSNKRFDLELSESLEGIGVGTLVERAIEKDLLKSYPDFKIKSSYDTEPERRRQLEKRGRKVGEAILLSKAAELTRKRMTNQLNKNKPRKTRPH